MGRDVHALKGTPRPKLAHAYVDAWSSAKSGKWLEDNYGYGHANTPSRPDVESDLVQGAAARPTQGRSPSRTRYLDRDIPRRRATYARMWEQVKAS